MSPLACYPIFLVSARSALLYGTFSLLTLLNYESALDKISGQGFWNFLLASLFAFSLGLFSNAVSVMIFAFVVLRSIAFIKSNRNDKAGKGKIIFACSSFAILTIGYLFLHTAVAGTTFGENYVRPITRNAMLQLKLFYVYIKMFLYPFDYPLYYTFNEPKNWAEPLVILALLTTALWLAVGIKRLFSSRWFDGFLLLMPLVAYFPYGAIPLNVPLAEHHFYVPLMWITTFLVIKIQTLLKKHERTAIACFLTIGVAYSIVTIHRGDIWSSEFKLSANAVKLSPSSTLAWDDLGVAYTNADRYEKAIWAYNRSLEIEPKNMSAMYNLGTTYFYMKKYDEAVKALMKYREMMSRHKPTYYEDGIIGMALVRQGKFSEALPFLDSAILNGVRRSDIYIDKITALVELHRADEAIPLCGAVRSFDGKNPNGLLWCARAEFASGNLQGAIAYMDKLFSMGVYNAETAFLGASLLRASGRGNEALRLVEGALAKWSDNSKLWVMKGVLLEDLNMKDKAKQAYLKAIELGLPPEVEKKVTKRSSKIKK